MITLFIYGSLRRGESAHGFMASSRFVGSARTEPGYRLVSLGAYPAMARGGSGQVVGELFEVDAETLARLDEYEDYPELYTREEVPLVGGGSAVAYMMRPVQADRFPEIPGGDWVLRSR